MLREEVRLEGEITKLNGHYILCGYGRVGRQVAEELALGAVPFVVGVVTRSGGP